MTSLILFFQFMKYGLLCFGGGYMIIPLLYTDMVQKKHIFTPEAYGNLLSVSQMTPGATSVNTATYVGYMQDGLLGAFSATIGLFVPTFVLASLVLLFLDSYKNTRFVIGFFKGVKWAAFIMILSAIGLFAKISVLDMSKGWGQIHINGIEVGMMILTILLARKISFTCLLILSAVIGWGLSFL